MQDLWERKMETWLQGMDGFSYWHGNAGSSIMFLYFSKKEKRLLAAGRSQCDYAVFGQFINLSLFLLI